MSGQRIQRGAGVLMLLATLFLCSFRLALAADLSVITSYPPSFYEPFQQAFEAHNPDIRLTVVQRNTSSASRFVMEKPDVVADIFWASATDAFELLKRRGALRKIHPRQTGAPERVLGYPLNDPDLLARIDQLAYAATAISEGNPAAQIPAGSDDDLTDLARALTLFRQTRDELVQSAKLAALGRWRPASAMS